MKIDTTQVIKKFDGSDLKEYRQVDPTDPQAGVKHFPVTVREVIYYSLNRQGGDNPILPEEKSRIAEVCQKMYASKEADFTVEERALIKSHIQIVQTPEVVGFITQLFDK